MTDNTGETIGRDKIVHGDVVGQDKVAGDKIVNARNVYAIRRHSLGSVESEGAADARSTTRWLKSAVA